MSLKNVRYIIFDLNGTLVGEDYIRYDEVLEKILKCRRRRQERRLTVKDLREVSKGKCSLSEMIAKLYEVKDPEAVSRQFLKVESSRITPREKAYDILEALRDKYGLILCTDTTGIAKEVVKNLDLSRYFIEIFYSCDIGYLKSERKFWTILLSRFLDARPQEFMIVGDNPRADMFYPNRLKMHTVKIENPNKIVFDYREPPTNTKEEKPEYHIKDLEEILPLLGL